MNDAMKQEMERTIQVLQASMPVPKRKQISILPLLRIAVSEFNGMLLLLLFVIILAFGTFFAKTLSVPMLVSFCTAPVPMLLLSHRYLLGRSERTRELEATFRYSYAEMLLARTVVISCDALIMLLGLASVLHYSVGENFLRLALCGAVPGIYFCVLLMLLCTVTRDQGHVTLSVAVLWGALSCAALPLSFDRILRACSTGFYAVLFCAGAVLYSICWRRIKNRRISYAFPIG